MPGPNNQLFNYSSLVHPREVNDFTDYRTVKGSHVVFTENKPRNILFVGRQSKYFSENMLEFNYVGTALETISEVNEWFFKSKEIGFTSLPKALICEVNLTDGDVYELFTKLKSENYLDGIPFIAVGENDNVHRSKALKTGIDDFYHFPLNFVDLHKRIVFLDQFRKRKAKLVEIDDSLFMNKIPFSKRLFDIVFSSIALLLASPVLIIVCILIKLESKGPILYRSKRVGTGYKIFDFYKFRSMRVGADAELAKLKHLNQYGVTNKFVKISNDPRVTKVGHFIRKTSIDEIPQLFNVLIGDMSIVGNRPLPLYEAEQLTIDKWSKRFLAPAGITGLWQVTKRGKKDMSDQERLQLDVMYAKKYSIWLDMMIILKTFPAMLQKEKV